MGIGSHIICRHALAGHKDSEERRGVGPESVCYTKEQIMEKVAFTEQYFDSV